MNCSDCGIEKPSSYLKPWDVVTEELRGPDNEIVPIVKTFFLCPDCFKKRKVALKPPKQTPQLFFRKEVLE